MFLILAGIAGMASVAGGLAYFAARSSSAEPNDEAPAETQTVAPGDFLNQAADDSGSTWDDANQGVPVASYDDAPTEAPPEPIGTGVVTRSEGLLIQPASPIPLDEFELEQPDFSWVEEASQDIQVLEPETPAFELSDLL